MSSLPFPPPSPNPTEPLPQKKKLLPKGLLISPHRSAGSLRTFFLLIFLLIVLVYRYRDEFNLGLSDDPFTPDSHWLLNDETLPYFITFIPITVLIYFVSFLSTPTFSSLRLGWSIISFGLLIIKLHDFYRDGQLLYLIDFCYIANVKFAYELWRVPTDIDNSAISFTKAQDKQSRALFVLLNGPVGGGTFMLNTMLSFHHFNVFSSFWLHVVPAFFTYSLRWRWYPKVLTEKYGTCDIKASENKHIKRENIYIAIKEIYFPWVFCHWLFLLVLPHTPLSKHETLFDFIINGDKEIVRDDPFPTWALKITAYLFAHFLLSLQGMAAASMSFSFQYVHYTWLIMIFLSCTFSGFVFYETSIKGSSVVLVLIESAFGGTLGGFKKSALVWSVLIIVYFYSRNIDEGRGEVRKSKIRERRISQESQVQENGRKEKMM